MAARWIGLARPHRRKTDKPGTKKPGTKKAVCRHPIDRTLRGFGAACVLGAGFMFNWALFPEASGQAPAMLERPIAFFALEPAPLPAAAAPIDEEEVRLLAVTAWGEARSEGELGMRAVAHVMVNRVGERFGEDLETVILAPKQFSAWNVGDPNRALVQNPERYARRGANRETWETAQQVAREVLSGQSVDPTEGALFYHTRAISPWWSRYGEGERSIGAHVFYRDVPNQPFARRGRVTRTATGAPAANTAAAVQQTGARAGRVNGVIQYAPARDAAANIPAEAPIARRDADPALMAALTQLPSSAGYIPRPSAPATQP